MPVCQGIGNLLNRMKKSIVELNIFHSNTSSAIDENEIKIELISTRIFLLFLVVFLGILTGYISEIQLYKQYSTIISCPCTTVSFPYEQFLNVKVTYHQICQSIYTTQFWINLIKSSSIIQQPSPTFRYLGGPLFQLLTSFCSLTNTTIDQGLNNFYKTLFISGTVMSLEIFRKQTDELIELFISSTTNSFTRSLDIIRDATHHNGIISGLLTNFDYSVQSYKTPRNIILYSTLSDYHTFTDSTSNCSCLDSPSCIIPIYVNNGNSFLVPGMYAGCFVVEALLQSNLICLYNQSCIDDLRYALNTSATNLTTTALDLTLPTQYQPNTTINDILSKLMVEQWINTTSHRDYYNQCNPIQCQYSYVGKNDFITVITTIIGLIGGLITILKVVVPRLVAKIRSFQHRQNTEHVPIRTRIVGLWIQLKILIIKLNLFHSDVDVSEDEIKGEIISTRVYVILLVLSILTLTIYRLQVKIIQTITIPSPSYTKYLELHEIYSSSLTCPCTNIGIEQGNFINIDATFHQSGQGHLQFVASWCRLANESLRDGRLVFNSQQLITQEVLSIDILEKEVQSLSILFFTSTISTFVRSLSIVHETIHMNALQNGFQTNFYPQITGTFPLLNVVTATVIYPPNACSCAVYSTCTAPNIFPVQNNSNTIIFTFPGLLTGCYLDESTFQSTLQCYYNQTCLDTVHHFLQSTLSTNITALNRTVDSQYNETSIIRDIVNNMMIENWTAVAFHQSFYETCQPSLCTYSYQTQNSISAVITIVIQLVGGLTVLLKILVPKIVKIFRSSRCIHHENTTQGFSINQIFIKIKDFVKNFNLFHSKISFQTKLQRQIQLEVMSTRLFVFLFIVSLTIFVILISLIPVKQTVTFDKPSYENYSILYKQQNQSLECSCTTLSIEYNQFLQVKVNRTHQICQSIYITDQWILFISQRPNVLYVRDFRILGPSFFRALASLCTLTAQAISDELIAFHAQQFVTRYVISFDLFQEQVRSSIEYFITSTTLNFIRSLQLVRDTTQGNILFATRGTNMMFTFTVPDNKTVILSTIYTLYGNSSSLCSCQDTSQCVNQSRIYTNYTGETIKYSLPGMYAGCFVVEALLQSNLICLYNQSCIDDLRYALNASATNLTTTALDLTLPTQYQLNTSINDILSKLMVEQWINTTSHRDYYNQCNPIQCQYSYVGKNDFITVITTIIGLVGGLNTILRFVTPRLIKIYSKYQTNRVQPFIGE
ncbi:unnamed protein product [Adineta steineri]|uniref:Uncharacterized protein n=1 Tax=Adineta steineri TaxID=433720 RepID=A0A819NJZ0_9BILA|nr:unnamed protein product [Adineta steineri]